MASEADDNLPLEIGHVLFVDIVGYSKLLIEEQKDRLRQLTAIVLATSQVAKSTGEQLVRLPTGDGMALVFRDNSEEPAQCALEIAAALKKHPELPVRMGIHSGPVSEVPDVNGRTNIAGAGINMAQRVMDCGDAGHVLLSQRVADDLGQYRQWSPYLHDLGECEVKHGVRVRVVNFYTGELGKPAVPEKFRKAKAARLARFWKIAALVLPVALLAAAGLYYRWHQSRPLTDKDTVVLADFSNTTGDPVFDATLRQGLAVQLEQSPFLSLVSDSQISQTLRLMGKPADAKLTPEISRELGERVGSKAFIAGSIANLGSDYIVGLRAVNCVTGDSMAEEQVQAAGKERVLDALSRAATKLREKLGESLGTVQKFDTPLEQATTTSLEALQAYSLGMRSLVGAGDNAAALASFQRAIEIDPQFVNAYATLGEVYSNLNETVLAAQNFKRAFELRQKVSEAEKFHIESAYYSWGSGNLQKALPVYEQWEQTYPRDYGAPNNLGDVLFQLGEYDRALAQEHDAVRLDPAGGLAYGNLFVADLFLGRFDEARAVGEEAQAKGHDSLYLHWLFYQLAFDKNDAAEMARQAAWAVGKPGVEDLLLDYEANTAAYSGRLEKARELSRRAVALALQEEEKETAATYWADAAIREGLLGNSAEASQRATAALGLSTGRDVQFGAALALALAGDAGQAQKLTDDLASRFPEDTQVQFNYLPALRAQLALDRNDSATAIQALETAAPYELGIPGEAGFAPALYPVYVRGESYLAAHQGSEAAAEFQKILDHRGIVFNELIGALAHLGLARASALSGDLAKAKAGYKDFFALWKNADPDIPILKLARAEYAKLE